MRANLIPANVNSLTVTKCSEAIYKSLGKTKNIYILNPTPSKGPESLMGMSMQLIIIINNNNKFVERHFPMVQWRFTALTKKIEKT